METRDYVLPMSKKQLAIVMKISNTTLGIYLNNVWYDELKSRGYNKVKKVLSPRQLTYIQSQWDNLDLNLMYLNPPN